MNYIIIVYYLYNSQILIGSFCCPNKNIYNTRVYTFVLLIENTPVMVYFIYFWQKKTQYSLFILHQIFANDPHVCVWINKRRWQAGRFYIIFCTCFSEKESKIYACHKHFPSPFTGLAVLPNVIMRITYISPT